MLCLLNPSHEVVEHGVSHISKPCERVVTDSMTSPSALRYLMRLLDWRGCWDMVASTLEHRRQQQILADSTQQSLDSVAVGQGATAGFA